MIRRETSLDIQATLQHARMQICTERGERMVDVGTILWEMIGKRRNKQITWYASPRCVEKVTEHMYMFGDGCGISHNGVGRNMFLSRKECIDHFLEKNESLVQEIGIDEPTPKDCCTLPRTDWQDLEVVKFDSVNVTSVYLNGLGNLLNVTNQLPWKKEWCEPLGIEIETITLAEIYDYLNREIEGKKHSPIVTVFVNDPMRCEVYQCGNYQAGVWVHLGSIQGYA